MIAGLLTRIAGGAASGDRLDALDAVLRTHFLGEEKRLTAVLNALDTSVGLTPLTDAVGFEQRPVQRFWLSATRSGRTVLSAAGGRVDTEVRNIVPVRDSLAERQRELAQRHEVFEREHPGSARRDDLLERVFDATDDLMRVVDEAQARALRRRRLIATALLATALTAVVLVAAGVLPAAVLIAAALALAAAAALWLTAYPGKGRASAPAASDPSGPGTREPGTREPGTREPGARETDVRERESR